MPVSWRPYAIFDMDGTLLDSTGMWDLVADRVLARWNMRFDEQDRDNTVALTIEGTAQYYVQRYHLPVTAPELADCIRTEARRAYTSCTTLKPGAADVVDALRAKGVRLCVASGTDKPLVDAALGHLGILDRFEFTLSCLSPRGKQDPEVYLRALKAFGSPDPAQVMVFEDSPTALATARQLGLYTVAVWDTYTADAWPDLGQTADSLCERWPDWLAQNQM